MKNTVKVEMSIKTLAIIGEALGEANSVEWLRGDAGDGEAKARYNRLYRAFSELRIAACDAIAGSITGNNVGWSGVFRWLTACEGKGLRLAWSARDAAVEAGRAEVAARIVADIARAYGPKAESEVA